MYLQQEKIYDYEHWSFGCYSSSSELRTYVRRRTNIRNVRVHVKNKLCSPCLHSLMTTEANVWDNSRADQWKPGRMFYFFYKILTFRLNKEKDDLKYQNFINCEARGKKYDSYKKVCIWSFLIAPLGDIANSQQGQPKITPLGILWYSYKEFWLAKVFER